MPPSRTIPPAISSVSMIRHVCKDLQLCLACREPLLAGKYRCMAIRRGLMGVLLPHVMLLGGAAPLYCHGLRMQDLQDCLVHWLERRVLFSFCHDRVRTDVQNTRGVTHTTRVAGILDNLLLDLRRVTRVAIGQQE